MEEEREKEKTGNSTELQRLNVSGFLLLFFFFFNLVSGISELCVSEIASPHFLPWRA